ncbi:MAG: protein kinase, partial [Planctomycetes bacterium]|nr:protein kinase [Planctomycetota bacterium]
LPEAGHRGFGGWAPLARLGGGSMGAVWLAARGDGPLAVVKTAASAGTPPLLAGEDGSVWDGQSPDDARAPEDELSRRFAREARITASMSHPRIIPCLDGGVAADCVRYLVLDWVAEGDLSAHLRRSGPLAPLAALAIADQLADALDHAHGRGVVHRDLKPANVFVREDGSVLLGDFGLARPTATGATRLTLAGVAVGTPTTMAPEQIEGRDAVDGRADLYALGCLICECLTGRPPFLGRSAEVMHKHRTAAAPDLDALVPGLPAGTADLVERLLAKNPDDRPADAAQVRLQLAPLLRACGGEPGRAESLATGRGPDPLLLLGPDEDPAIVLWSARRIVLGKERGPGTDLVLRDYPEHAHRDRLAKVSRRHAAICLLPDGTATVEDLGSANGTCVDGERLPPRTIRPLADGCELVLAGVARLRVRITAGRALILQRPDNRPGLTYALVGGSLRLGGPGSDLPLAQATSAVELSWDRSGWLVDGASSSYIDLKGMQLRISPLAGWL